MNPLRLSLVTALVLFGSSSLRADPQAIPVSSLGTQYQLIGKLHVPLGDPVIITAVARPDDQTKTGREYLQIQVINGVATQEDIRICAEPFFGKWGEKGPDTESLNLPEFIPGKTYQMKGYETGAYGGTPKTVWEDVKVRVDSPFAHQFRTYFIVTKAKIVDPVRFRPFDFAGRWAELEGVARSKNGEAVMEQDDWEVIVDPKAPWPKEIEGKSIETAGVYAQSSTWKKVQLLNGKWRLVRLEDQVGRVVELRGAPFHSNGSWLLSYRGKTLYLEGVENLPGWTDNLRGRPILIRGTLEKAMLPDADRIEREPHPDLKECYVIRKPSWEALPSLSGPERLSGKPCAPLD